ncbi:hypothetical protein Q31b_00890 [Novipirellula aureliae]|uniref:Replication-relaxation n=1 Tax=Novipirellula aureliae TaxID=2527966 RepID=A0A5C6E7X6_9BACT|nr:hypothetical protein [Novipirellula aureliae]TWU44918.1 hypothetical protein Q31b_00890 [Novipirellula aureliae]
MDTNTVTALTTRDREVILALCTKVRLFTLDQIASTWWSESRSSRQTAQRRLAKLAEGELVHRQRLAVSPLPKLDTPVIAWSPGDMDPDFGAAAWILQSRWKEGSKTTTVYTATKKATRLFGGKSHKKLKSTPQATHDLGVSQIYLGLLQTNSENAKRWIGEDILAPYRIRQKLPDAVIADAPNTNPDLVLEFGGSYNRPRVQAFHKDCKDRNLPYELW